MSVGSGGFWVGPATMRLAEAVPPLPASVEVTTLVVFFCVPLVVPLTFTAKVHAALAARVAPERLTLFEPAAAVIVPPPQLPANPLGVPTTWPEGKVSVKPIPLRELAALGFDRLKVSEVVPFKATLAAANPFEIAGGNLAKGGVLPDGDELPPHAVVQNELEAMTRGKDSERAFIQNAAPFRSFL